MLDLILSLLVGVLIAFVTIEFLTRKPPNDECISRYEIESYLERIESHLREGRK